MGRSSRVGIAVLLAGASSVAAGAAVHAQLQSRSPGETRPGTQREREAWELARRDELIEAREHAEAILDDDPDSFIAHFVLGWVQHYGEGSDPKALYHYQKARSAYRAQHGTGPSVGGPWRWHARILQELAKTHGNLEHYRKRLALLDRHNELYDPDLTAQRAWALMKLGHYERARLAAQQGLQTDDPRQRELALNALCAIEFEAGHDRKSYDACQRAVEHARRNGMAAAVDLLNFAEASRSVFKLHEAEQVLLEATEAPAAWYGNPWRALAALYTRQGRFAEALDALKHVPRYRAKRPAHVRNSDRNEARRTLAAFLLAAGKAREALQITDRALVRPDRRAHTSRDPAQDRAVVALLDREARRLAAEGVMERASGQPWYGRIAAWVRASWLRFQAWTSGREAARVLNDRERLVGIFRIGTASSAIMPPWLAGDLAHVTGSGVAREALERARARDDRDGADAYYDAFEAEAALIAGNPRRAVRLAARAIDALGRSEALLRARAHAIAAEAQRRRGRYGRAAEHYDHAFQQDPGVLRRLGWELPVTLDVGSSAAARAAADMLGASPRVEIVGRGLELRVRGQAHGGRICLLGANGAVLGCGRAHAERQAPEAVARRMVGAFHRDVFAPRVDLSQAEIHSLEGSNRTTRDPLKEMF